MLLRVATLATLLAGAVPLHGQPAAVAPVYTPPDYPAVLQGAAPVRVLLAAAQPMLAWKGAGEVRVLNAANGTPVYTAPAGELVGIARETPDRSCALRKAGVNFAIVSGTLRLVSDKPLQYWTASPDNWSSSPGPLLVVPLAAGTFSIVRERPLEEYLRNVVPAEMPATFHPQALRAQAILARTYTLHELGRHAAEGADLCATVHCQVFSAESRRTPATDDALRATHGRVLLYHDRPADVFYHSSCGGVTDDAGYVWGPEYARPYLTGSIDAAGKRAPSGIREMLTRTDSFCARAANLRWTRKFSAAEVNGLVRKNLVLVTGDPAVIITAVTGMTVEERTPFGRAATLRVEGDGASILVYGDAIRWLFGAGLPGPEGLWSTLFDLDIARDGGGAITGYTFTGLGRGHGLGMCQWGTDGRARAGHSYREILHAYFPGTVVSDGR